MNAAQWIATVCFAIWGIFHLIFGIATFVPAMKNQLFAVFKGLLGGHPNLDEIEEGFKPLEEKAPEGVKNLFLQHACNLFKPGTISCILAFYLIHTGDYPFVTFVLTLDIFFDHNFYGIFVDFPGYAEPVASALLYFANIGVIAELYDLAYNDDQKYIASWVFFLFTALATAVMLVSTGLHVKRAISK